MDNGALFDRIVQSLAFEVEAVPKDNAIKLTSGANTTPVNVKVRLRKKDHRIAPKQEIAVIPKYDQPHASSRLRLASSDQTVISFNMLLEADLETMIHSPKPRKRFFNGLISSVCLGTKSDDDDFPYLPSSNKNVEPGNGALRSIIPIHFLKHQGINESHRIKHKKLFGKCKPGGCLDPPFGEDRYAYKPTKKQIPGKSTNQLQSKSQIVKAETEKGRPKDTKKKQDTSPVVSLYEATPKKKPSNASHSFSLITYPLNGDNSNKQFVTKSSETEKLPSDRNHTRQDSADSYFLPPKSDSKPKKFLTQQYFEQNNDQNDKDNKNTRGEFIREPPHKKIKGTGEQQSLTLDNSEGIREQKPTVSQFIPVNKSVTPYDTNLTGTSGDVDFDKKGFEPFSGRMLHIDQQTPSGPNNYTETVTPTETAHFEHFGATSIPPTSTTIDYEQKPQKVSYLPSTKNILYPKIDSTNKREVLLTDHMNKQQQTPIGSQNISEYNGVVAYENTLVKEKDDRKKGSEKDYDKKERKQLSIRMLNTDQQSPNGLQMNTHIRETGHQDQLRATSIPPTPTYKDHEQKSKTQNITENNHGFLNDTSCAEENIHNKTPADEEYIKSGQGQFNSRMLQIDQQVQSEPKMQIQSSKPTETEYFDQSKVQTIPPSSNIKDLEQKPEDMSNFIGNKVKTSLYQDKVFEKHGMFLPTNLNKDQHAPLKSQNRSENKNATLYNTDINGRTSFFTNADTPKTQKEIDSVAEEKHLQSFPGDKGKKSLTSKDLVDFGPDYKHHQPVDHHLSNFGQTNEELVSPFNNFQDVDQNLRNNETGHIDSTKEQDIVPASNGYDSQRHGVEKLDFEPSFIISGDRKSITKKAPILNIKGNFDIDDKEFNIMTGDILTTNKALKPPPLATQKTKVRGPSSELGAKTVERQEDNMGGSGLKYINSTLEPGNENYENLLNGMAKTENEFSELQKHRKVSIDPLESIKKKALLAQNQNHLNDEDPWRSDELLSAQEQNDFNISPTNRSQNQYDPEFEQTVGRLHHDADNLNEIDEEDDKNRSKKQFAIESDKFGELTQDFDEIAETQKRKDMFVTDSKEQKKDDYNTESTHEDILSAQGYASKTGTQFEKRQELIDDIPIIDGIEVDVKNSPRKDLTNEIEKDMFNHLRSDIIQDKLVEGEINHVSSKENQDKIFHITNENAQNSEYLRSDTLIQDKYEFDVHGERKTNFDDLSQTVGLNDQTLNKTFARTQSESDLDKLKQSNVFPFDTEQINQESGELYGDKLVFENRSPDHIKSKQSKENTAGPDKGSTFESYNKSTTRKPYRLPDDILFDQQSEQTKISPKTSLVSILKSGSNENSITLDLAFQLTKPDNKGTLIKTLSRDQADKYPDNALVINGTTRFNDLVTIPIGPNREMNLRIVRSNNKHGSSLRDFNQMSPDKSSGQSHYIQEMPLDADFKNDTIYESRIWNAQIVKGPGSQDSVVLRRIYEEQLVPLKVIIANFKVQIDSLVNQQLMIRKRLLEVRKVQKRKEKKVCGCINRQCM